MRFPTAKFDINRTILRIRALSPNFFTKGFVCSKQKAKMCFFVVPGERLPGKDTIKISLFCGHYI